MKRVKELEEEERKGVIDYVELQAHSDRWQVRALKAESALKAEQEAHAATKEALRFAGTGQRGASGASTVSALRAAEARAERLRVALERLVEAYSVFVRDLPERMAEARAALADTAAEDGPHGDEDENGDDHHAADTAPEAPMGCPHARAVGTWCPHCNVTVEP